MMASRMLGMKPVSVLEPLEQIRWNFNWNSNISIQENVSENVV